MPRSHSPSRKAQLNQTRARTPHLRVVTKERASSADRRSLAKSPASARTTRTDHKSANPVRLPSKARSIKDQIVDPSVQEHIVRLIRKPGAALAFLGATQHAIKLFLRAHPDYATHLGAAANGAKKFNVAKLSTAIGGFRAFSNFFELLDVYDAAKSTAAQPKGFEHGLLSRRNVATASNAAYACYVTFLALNYLGSGGVIGVSKDAAKHALRVDRFDRISSRFAVVVFTLRWLTISRDEWLAKKEIAKRKKRSGRYTNEENELFYKEMRDARAKRKRQAVVSGLWYPAAIHWSMKNSPLPAFTGSLSTMMAQAARVYYYWKDTT